MASTQGNCRKTRCKVECPRFDSFVLNRGNLRQATFEKDADYEAFLRVLREGFNKYSVEVFCFTLMHNHWHLILRPCEDGQMGRWAVSYAGLPQRTHCHTMHTIIAEVAGTCTNLGSRVFRFRMTGISMWLVDTSNVTHFVLALSLPRRSGDLDRFGDGTNPVSPTRRSFRLGHCRACRNGTSESIHHCRHRNSKRSARVWIVDGRWATRSGPKKWLKDTDCGTLLDRQVDHASVQNRKSRRTDANQPPSRFLSRPVFFLDWIH